MADIKVNLSEDFLSIIEREDFDKFTILELRSAYMALSANKLIGKDEAQRYVYRQVLKLKKKGLLRRVDSKSSNKTTYIKTELFSEAIFNIDRVNGEGSAKLNNQSSEHVIKVLREKIQIYKSELLSSMGESDEYKALYTDFPHLKAPLQDSYNNAREKNSKLHGRIKAVETLIALEQGISVPNEAS